MREKQALLQSQLDCLEKSVLALATLCKNLSLDLRLPAKLSEMTAHLSAPTSQPSLDLDLREALELIPQARASVSFLQAIGYMKGDGRHSLASHLLWALDDIERAMGHELRKSISKRVYGLYVIIDPEVTGGRDPLEVARAALRGGARMIQLRDKLREKGQTLPLARSLKELCVEFDALLIINDHADLAALVGADGLHIGQGDLPVADARRILKPEQIIGRSNHVIEEALESQAQGADHVALGAIYPTPTKVSISGRPAIGPEAVRRVKETARVPVVAIGGINEQNAEPVVEAGADAICVTSAVGLARDPEEASRRLVQTILRSGGKA